MVTTKPDLLKLYNFSKYKEIEAILDSAEYTREEKVEMVTLPKNITKDDEVSLFSKLCKDYHRTQLLVKVFHILGDNLGNYIHELRKSLHEEYRFYLDQEKLLRVIVEESDVLTSLIILVYAMELDIGVQAKAKRLFKELIHSESQLKKNILKKKCIRCIHDTITGHTKDIFLCNDNYDTSNTEYVLYRDATLLEIAMHKHVDIYIIKDLVRMGGKDLLLLSERSLIQGAIVEYEYSKRDEIIKLLLEVGGKDLVMNDRSWHKQDANSYLNNFEFLSAKKEILCQQTYDWDDAIAEIMDMLINIGKKELVMKNNEKGQSILHKFKYFVDSTFLPIVKRIKSIGGNELLSSKDDNGDTVLHTLARFYPQNNSKVFVSLEYWKTLACDRDLVMMQNKDGKTALHVACENSEVNAVKVLVEKGGRDLVWKRDNHMNTALHLLPFRVSREKDADNFQAFKHIVEVGGVDLLHSLNNREKKPMTSFFMQALEFEFDEESSRAKIKTLEEKAELDRKAKLNLEKELKALRKKNEDLEWKWINRKKKKHSDKELEEVAKSQKNKLKAQKKDIEVLNDTIKELQVENESHLMNEKTKVDSIKLLIDEIKQLQDAELSLQSKVKEQHGMIQNLQDERKQADLDFEIVKTMHEENKNEYENSLDEIRKLKEEKQAQQHDILDQKEMNQKLQEELREKDARIEVNGSKLRDLEDDNNRLREAENNVKRLLRLRAPAPIKVEENNGEVDESLKGIRVLNLEEEIQALHDTINEQKQNLEEKQKENNLLKDANESLNNKIASSSMKRSRDDTEQEIDCIEEDEDDIYGPPSKRGKTRRASSTERETEYTRNHGSSLEGEIEDLMNDLEYEKSSHMKTLKRLKVARKALKKNN